MQRYESGKSNREINSLELAIRMSKKTAEASTLSTSYLSMGASYMSPGTIFGAAHQPAFITNTLIDPTILRGTIELPASVVIFRRACAAYEQEQIIAAKIAAEQQFRSSRIAAFMHQQELLLRLSAASARRSPFHPHVTIADSPVRAPLITPRALSLHPSKKLTFGVDDTVHDKDATADGKALEDIRKSKKPFPMKLYTILNDAEKEGNEDIISFQENGRAFSIHDKARFIAEIAPRYFSTSQYSSFKRQLNLYGFKYTVLGTKHTPSYFHHEFIRENLTQCFAMKRKPQVSAVSRCPISVKPDLACAKLYVKNLYQNGAADCRVLLYSNRKSINANPPAPVVAPSSRTPTKDAVMLQDMQRPPRTFDL